MESKAVYICGASGFMNLKVVDTSFQLDLVWVNMTKVFPQVPKQRWEKTCG